LQCAGSRLRWLAAGAQLARRSWLAADWRGRSSRRAHNARAFGKTHAGLAARGKVSLRCWPSPSCEDPAAAIKRLPEVSHRAADRNLLEPDATLCVEAQPGRSWLPCPSTPPIDAAALTPAPAVRHGFSEEPAGGSAPHPVSRAPPQMR